jgi:hypothetical protein
MLQQLQDKAKAMAGADADARSRSGFVGTVGSILGGMAGSLTYRDPTNIFGKSALTRIATEMGTNAFAEAYDLFTGAAENQKILTGEASTAGEMAADIASAGLGAGIVRGAGEAAATGFRALARRFGAHAPDVATAAIAKEAEDIAGPPPYGEGRAAIGLHHAELMDAISRDAPLSLPGATPTTPGAEISVGSLASRDLDSLFSGTAQPLSRIFDAIPQHVLPKLESVNADIGRASDFADDVAARAKMAEEAVPAMDALSRRLAEVTQAIMAGPEKRTLGRLTKEKADLEQRLGEAQARANDLQALASQAAFASQRANDLRLRRAALVRDAAKRVPGVRSTVVADHLAATAGPNLRPIDITPRPSLADEVKTTLAAPVAEPRAPKIIPAGSEPGSGEAVDLGQQSGPVMRAVLAGAS